jgi:hypothetical protein
MDKENMVYIHTIKSGNMTLTGKQMEMENIMLSKISQTQRQI